MSIKTPSQRSPKDVCILELLRIPRPINNSCFSEQQIDMLYDIWRTYMLQMISTSEPNQEQAMKSVNSLYPLDRSIEKKYNTLPIESPEGSLKRDESAWVMGNASPTEFVAYLRQQTDVMYILSMSFKPRLLHGGMLEAPDLWCVLVRYEFWLRDDKNRTVNILGVTDNTTLDATRDSAKNMAENLASNWSKCRFHFAILNEKQHWVGLLIDRVGNSFEYYNSFGHGIDLTKTEESTLSMQVAILYDKCLILSDNTIDTKSMHSVRPGHQHQVGGSQCGIYVLLFLHTRVVLGKTFHDFAHTEISNKTCEELTSLFFDMDAIQPAAPKKERKITSKFGDYDYRLAAIEFERYILELKDASSDLITQNKLEAFYNSLRELVEKPDESQAIYGAGTFLQQQILSMLPKQYKDFQSSDLWTTMIQQVVEDPLTLDLRKNGNKGSSKRRVDIALQLFKDIIGWTQLVGAPADKVGTLNRFIIQLINTVYLPALRFDKQFEGVEMSAEAFIRKVMSRRDTISFGVHFMREVLNYVTNELNIPIPSDSPWLSKFSQKSSIVKPVTIDNLKEITNVISQCEEAMREARLLIDQSTILPPTNPFSQTRPITVRKTPSVSPVLIDRIIAEQKIDMENNTFDPNRLKPFNFPLDVAQFHVSQQNVVLPVEFANYSITSDRDRALLLSEPEFLIHYTMAALWFIAALNTKKVTNFASVQVLFESLLQFYQVSQPGSKERQLLCDLLRRFYEYLNPTPAFPNAEFTSLKSNLESFVNACPTHLSSEFIHTVLDRQKMYESRLV